MRIGTLFLCAFLTACTASRRVPAPPPIETSIDWFRGGGIAGPLVAEGVRGESAHVLHARYRLWIGDAAPNEKAVPLASRVRLVAATVGGQPVEASSRLLAGAWILDDATAPSGVLVDEMEGVLPPDATVQFGGHQRSREPSRELLVQLTRAGDDTTVSLVLADLAEPDLEAKQAAEDAGSPPPKPQLRRELIVLADRPRVGSRFVFAFPGAVAELPGKALVIELEVGEGATPAALARAREAMQRAATVATDLTTAQSAAATRRQELGLALHALGVAERRPALVWLATTNGARFAESFALSADDGVMLDFAKSLVKEEKVALDSSDPAFAWKLETAVLRYVIARAQKRELEPELAALLIERVGELGRYPGSIETLIGRSADLKAFDGLVLEENRLFLEARDPGARVRAFDWLVLRGAAPKGFDPLATKAQRKKALAAMGGDA